LGDVGRAKHRPLQALQSLVDFLVAAGAGHRLAQGLELGLGAVDACGLGGDQ
jgi:hypothetical protein